jgi:hypothetical protein
VRDLLAAGAVRPLHALVANAGTMSPDTRQASPDGYEVTFAVNYLAHAQLIGDLLGSFTAPARVVLLGSNTYHANVWRKLLGVPEARWADPVELARPATGERAPGMAASGVAYSNAKLAILYYACRRRNARGRCWPRWPSTTRGRTCATARSWSRPSRPRCGRSPATATASTVCGRRPPNCWHAQERHVS